MNYRLICAAALPALLLAACERSMSLKVDSAIPVPLVARLPLSLGVVYDDGLRNYAYEEDSEERPNWKIDSGASHAAMFEQVLPAMFQEVTEVAAVPAAVPVDAVLTPGVAEMQFALPAETGLEFYEAWIKYELALHDRDGLPIAHWTVTGYGKSPPGLLKSRAQGLNAAVNQALRAAGARFALGFSQVAEIEAWLAGRSEQ